jgi:O-antigen ligase
LFSLAFAYAAFQKGGVWPKDWSVFLLALAVLSGVYWLRTPSSERAPSPARWLGWLLAALPCYAAFQLLPLPLPVLRVLSPARAEVHEGLRGALEAGVFAPLSVKPAATLEHALRIAGCVAAFLLLRELAFRFADRPWRLALPLVAIAGLEGALGLAQFYAEGSEGFAHGTYVNRNHYAGLLEMSLPFAVMYPVAVLRRVESRHRSPAGPALAACAWLAVAAIILLGIIDSLSRMGFVAALASLFLMGALALGAGRRAWRKWAAVGLVGALVVIGFVFLPPDQLIARFGDLAATDEISGDTRVNIWRETLGVIAAFPVFGCGLGGYQSAFFRYKRMAPAHTIDFAHNDYLQLLAELGVAGFALVAVLVVAALWMAMRAAVAHSRPGGRALGLACTGALAAILLHSLVDFNLYVPANAMLLTWIAALAAGLTFSWRSVPAWKPQGAPRVLEARVVSSES